MQLKKRNETTTSELFGILCVCICQVPLLQRLICGEREGGDTRSLN